MERLVKNIANGDRVVFNNGRFDNWCVYVVETDGSSNAPYDVQYFADLFDLSKKYPENKIYNDFILIYNKTSTNINHETIALINDIVLTYQEEDRNMTEKWFSVIYAGMIAEENKDGTILKKRIKRLGMHQVLIDGLSPDVAANFSKGKKWRDLDAIMKKKGF